MRGFKNVQFVLVHLNIKMRHFVLRLFANPQKHWNNHGLFTLNNSFKLSCGYFIFKSDVEF